MSIEDAFLHDILTHPDDDAPRLIYADWLDEHNDPRGEFIRVQCALAHLSDDDPRRWPLEQREQELLREHETKWLPKDIGNALCIFRRGYVEEIRLSPEDFVAEADRLFEQAPIRQLCLYLRGWTTMGRTYSPLAPIACSRHLAQIHSLHLTVLRLTRDEFHEFLVSPNLRQLTELQLSDLGLTEPIEGHPLLGSNAQFAEILHNLTELPCGDNLTSLHLANMTLPLDALRVLAYSSSLTNLRELNLNGNGLTHAAASVLAEGRLLSQLEMLHLDSNLLSDAGALTIRDWPTLPRLTRLSLGHNHMFAAGIQALAEAPALSGLISLDLFGNISCDAGTAALASSSRLTRLRALNLRFNGVGDEGVRALAQSETCSQLTRLNLTANRITSAGARALIASPHLPSLVRLDLPRNDIAAEEQQRLRERFGAFVAW
jgi:uncharacterized protein (TIGR02996 family)